MNCLFLVNLYHAYVYVIIYGKYRATVMCAAGFETLQKYNNSPYMHDHQTWWPQPLRYTCSQKRDLILPSNFLDKAKKNKFYVSKLPRAFIFQFAFDSAKFKPLIFLLAFFFSIFV